MHAIRPGPLWQAQLDPYAPCFTRPGFRDFALWGTGLALNVEEHTITQSLVGLEGCSRASAIDYAAFLGLFFPDPPRVPTSGRIFACKYARYTSDQTPLNWITRRSTIL